MGRQSARIYFNHKDHKEMVVWDGTKYVYHDKAYIWTPQGFELVWEKLFGLKLLYESLLPIQPVSSENNRYLYFVENNDASIIYRLEINEEEPEPEEHYTSNKYNSFSAPVSSRGFGIYAEYDSYSASFDYEILNLEDGTVSEVDTFNPADYGIENPTTFPRPELTNQEVSPAESGVNHNYASILSTFNQSYFINNNFIYFVAPTGISAMRLDNKSSDGSLVIGNAYDLGRLDDAGARGLLPRFLIINQDDSIAIYEYGAGVEYGYYSAVVIDTIPFSFVRSTGGGLNLDCIKVTRDDKLPVLATDNHIWLIQANTDDFSYTDTEIEVEAGLFDVHPSYKYALISEWWVYAWGVRYLKIVNIKTGQTVVDLTEEIGDLRTMGGYFVGHNCVYVYGYAQDSFTMKYRLYRWR